MKKRLLALLLALAMFVSLAACGSSSDSSSSSSSSDSSTSTSTEETSEDAEEAEEAEEEDDENAIKDLVTYQLTASELSTFVVVHTQSSADLGPLYNLYDTLVCTDVAGNITGLLAESWGTDDGGLTWTFNLRDDAVWVDYNGEYKADLTSADFVTSMEWILNAYKNGAYNSSMLTETVEGAQDYYDYTASLTEEEAMALEPDNETFLEMVGIETPDDYTVVYHCVAEIPYFDSVATGACCFPIPAGLLEEVGVENYLGIDNTTMWYSGAYIMTEYVYQNEKIFEPNPLWWGADEIDRFDSVTVKMVESNDVAYQLYQTGEIDYVQLTESNFSIIYDDETNEYHDYICTTNYDGFSFQIYFNYSKLDSDGNPDEDWNKAAANEAFRKSWYYGLDLTSVFKHVNAVDPMYLENNAYTFTQLCYTTDGTDYKDLVLANLGIPTSNDGDTPLRYDAELGEQYKEQAIEELTELGVSFPITVDYYISASSQSDLDTANILAQAISDSLGDDYVQLNILTYVSSYSQEVRTPQLQSIAISGWGADYSDPQNFLGQMLIGDENAYMSNAYSNVNDLSADVDYQAELYDYFVEFTDMVAEANTITTDIDARYEAYAEAEAYMIEHCFTIPLYYRTYFKLTKINDWSADYGTSRYLNWETNINGYTTEEYVAARVEVLGS